MTAPNHVVVNSDAPAEYWVAVTPDNDNDLAKTPRALFIGVGGNVKVADVNGGATVFKNLADGSILPVRAVRVYATDTSATDIVALY